jgi:hypothetical protein
MVDYARIMWGFTRAFQAKHHKKQLKETSKKVLRIIAFFSFLDSLA